MTDVLTLLAFTIIAPASVAGCLYWCWDALLTQQRRRLTAKSTSALAAKDASVKEHAEAAARAQLELEGIRRLNNTLLLDADKADKEIARLKVETASHAAALAPVNSARDVAQAERDALSTQLVSIYADLSRVDTHLYRRLRDLPVHDQRSLRDAMDRHKPQDYIAMANHAADVKRRLEDLKSVWLDPNTLEAPARDLLCTNLWVLEPGLRNAGHIFKERGLEAVVAGYFPGQRVPESTFKFLDTARKVDAAGIFLRRDQVCKDRPHGQYVFVIVETKRNAIAIDDTVMDEAFHYALNLRKMVPALAHWDFECFAIGGTIAGDVRVQRYRPGSKGNTVTVTPLSWRGLYERAAALMPAPEQLAALLPNAEVPPHLVFDTKAAENAGSGQRVPDHSEAFEVISFPRPVLQPDPAPFDLSLPRAAE